MKKTWLIATFLIACSPTKQTPEATSCVKTVISDEIRIESGVEKSFYWGYADIKYSPELAGIIFSSQSEKLKLIQSSNPTFRCRVLYIPTETSLDAWTSRHCLMSLAIADVKLFVFDDAFKAQPLPFDAKKLAKWSKTADVIKSISKIEKDKTDQDDFIRDFVVRNLYFNAFNSKIYDFVESRVDDLRFNAYHGTNQKTLPDSNYYNNLLAQALPEQAYLKRDLCATDFKQESSKAQHICFSTTDLVLFPLEKPASLTLEPFKKDLYSEWSRAHQNLDQAVTKYLLEDFAFTLARYCAMSVTDRTQCKVAKPIEDLIKIGDHFKDEGTSSAELRRIVDEAFTMKRDVFAKERFAVKYGHLKPLIAAFEQVGSAFEQVSKTYLNQQDVALAGIFTKKQDAKNEIGLLLFEGAFQNVHANLAPRYDGFYFVTNSNNVIFEKQDSGSLLLSGGFPLATLSTVNGEASSGGSASLGNVQVAQIEDMIDKDVFGGSDNLATLDQEQTSSETSILVEDPAIPKPDGSTEEPQIAAEQPQNKGSETKVASGLVRAPRYNGSSELGGVCD